jgi:hypothetical protein
MTRQYQIGKTLRGWILACLVALLSGSSAHGAWLGYRNDTGVPVIIQSAVVVNNQKRWGKPHTLFPGEIAWDAVPAPGARIVGVFDPKQNNVPVYSDGLVVGTADIFLSLQMVPSPQIPGRPPQPPQPRFIVTKPPTSPPGGPTPNPNMPRPPQAPPGSPGIPPAQKPPITGPGTPGNPPAKPPAGPGTPGNTPPPKSPANPPPSNPPGKSGGP